MSAPKRPQDHLPKTEKPKVESIPDGKRVTHKGVTVTVPKAALDDFELLDDLQALDVEGNASRLPSLLRKLVGDDFRKVMDALRNEQGRVTIEAGSEFLKDIFEAISPES